MHDETNENLDRDAFLDWLREEKGRSDLTAELYVGLVQGILSAHAQAQTGMRPDLTSFAQSTHANRKIAWRLYLLWSTGSVDVEEKCVWPQCATMALAQRLCERHFLFLYKKVCLPVQQDARDSRSNPRSNPNRVELQADGTARLWMTDKKGNEIQSFIVSQKDLPVVQAHRWSVSTRVDSKGNKRAYIITQAATLGGQPRKVLLLHRLLMQAPKGMEVDHVNGDPFDNRRENLRLVTRAQQAQNIATRSGTTSGHRNVYLTPSGKWHVAASKNRKLHNGGTFTSLGKALKAAKALRARLFTHHNEERELSPRKSGNYYAIEFQGKMYPSKTALARDFKLPYGVLTSRLKKRWSLEKALLTPVGKVGRPRTLSPGGEDSGR